MFVVRGWVMLGPVVSVVEFAWPPVEPELVLALPVSQPMESHVHCFRSFGLDLTIDHSFCHCIVGLDRGRRLSVSHFLQYDADVDCFARHYVEGRQFGFSGRGHYVFDYVRYIENGAIVCGDVVVVG